MKTRILFLDLLLSSRHKEAQGVQIEYPVGHNSPKAMSLISNVYLLCILKFVQVVEEKKY
jgi:hypothetical protein